MKISSLCYIYVLGVYRAKNSGFRWGEWIKTCPTQERLGELGAICHNFWIFCWEPEMHRVCLPRACFDMKRIKLFFFFLLITGGRCETNLIVWLWRLLKFFSQAGKKKKIKKITTFQEPNRSVNVMFAVFDSADASGRIFCLWCCGFDERLLTGLCCFLFLFFPFPFLS